MNNLISIAVLAAMLCVLRQVLFTTHGDVRKYLEYEYDYIIGTVE